MAMSIESQPGEGHRAQINVTPLIDVLLVLLIIFMVITPTMSVGLDAAVPQPSDSQKSTPPLDDPIIATVHGDRTVLLNQETVAFDDLGGRLMAALARSADHILFLRADKNLEFAQVAEVIDIAKGAGITRVALMTK